MGKKKGKSGAVKRIERFEEGSVSVNSRVMAAMLSGRLAGNIPGAYASIGVEPEKDGRETAEKGQQYH